MLARKVSGSNYFEIFILICIFLNTTTFAINHQGISKQFSEILSYIVILFTVIFNIEAVIKIIGFGKHYFYDRFN